MVARTVAAAVGAPAAQVREALAAASSRAAPEGPRRAALAEDGGRGPRGPRSWRFFGAARWVQRLETESSRGDRLDVNGGGPIW